MSDRREGQARNAAQQKAFADFALHIFVSLIVFTLFVLQALYGTMVSLLVARLIRSMFVLHVITALEYTLVVIDAAYLSFVMAHEAWKNFKRFLR